MGCANDKLNGPTGVNQSTPKPTALLILLDSLRESSSTPHKFAISRKVAKSIKDVIKCKKIAIAPIPNIDLGLTINDRIKRASSR